MGPSSARRALIAARICAGSAASAGDVAAAIPLILSAATPAARRSLLRPTSPTEKPSAPNFSATAVALPGPKPTTTMFFDMVSFLGAGSCQHGLDVQLDANLIADHNAAGLERSVPSQAKI